MRLRSMAIVASVAMVLTVSTLVVSDDTDSAAFDTVAAARAEISAMDVGEGDWPQFFGWSHRNNTPHGENIPAEWDVDSGMNILWSARTGSQTYGNVVVANGRVFLGTNNANGYVSRFPAEVDLGCLIALDEQTGEFLWQHSNTKLPTGLVHDWPDMGVCSAAYVDGERLWYVNNRGEVVCLDAEGFHDGVNDGPFTVESNQNQNEADIIWLYDMMGDLGVSQHNMCSCSITGAGDVIFVCTSNGVDESHVNIPAPDAPSFIAMNRDTGEVLWTDGSPGINILHGQWSSPTHAEFDGQAQAIFAGGDGWLYSFDPAGADGEAKLLWKFDCNPKAALYSVRGRSSRNHIIGTPVVYDGLVYVAVGEDPEHGEGNGHLWCIDPLEENRRQRRQCGTCSECRRRTPCRRVGCRMWTRKRVSRQSAQPRFRRRLPLHRRRHQRQRQAGIRRADAPLLWYGDHSGRHSLHLRFQRNRALPRRKDRGSLLDL